MFHLPINNDIILSCHLQLSSQVLGRKEGMVFYVASNSLGHVATSLSVAEGPYTALHDAAHLYSDQANLLGDPAETRTSELTLL